MEILSISALKDLYNETMAQADPKASAYPLMETPHTFLAVVALYLIISMQGPRWMEGFKPFQLRNFIIIYNFAMVLLSSYIFLTTCIGLIIKGHYSLSCETMNGYKDSPYWLSVGWLFVLSKLIEFTDTVLFILVKKNSHVTFLHVYHHSTMACFTWLGYKLVPGGTNIIYLLLNSFVHVVMYTYYGLSAMGPKVRKHLWWKRYLTVMQISQFLLYMAQGIINSINQCPIPRIFILAVYVYIVTILGLFVNFYIRTYVFKPKSVSQNGHIDMKTD